jgi:hypothetical protein
MFVGKEHPRQSSDLVRRSASSFAPAHTSPRFDQERENPSFIVNSLRSPSRATKLQQPHFQKLAHSFTHAENVTPAFPITSTHSLRSSTKERKSSPLFSCIPARFCRNGGYGANKERKSPARGAFAVGKSRGASAVRNVSRAASAHEKCRGEQVIPDFGLRLLYCPVSGVGCAPDALYSPATLQEERI